MSIGQVLSWLTFGLACAYGLSAILRYAVQRSFLQWGLQLRRQAKLRRKILLRSCSATSDQSIVLGFFHPYCNAGGGGERVLWAAVRTTQHDYPTAMCIVYSGDQGVSAADIVKRANDAFGIKLEKDRLEVLFLQKRHLVSAETWPRFTLIGQSLGSMILAYEAITALPPDIFIDTMGYAFTYPLIYYLLHIPVLSYTHYPTITSEMFTRISSSNIPKWIYWRLFATLYALMGRYADFVMSNSSWTMAHLHSIWNLDSKATAIVYPPCDTSALMQASATQKQRQRNIVCVAQFRPEKNHETLLQAFALFLSEHKSDSAEGMRMILIGTVRDATDQKRVHALKQLARDLGIVDRVEFCEDLPWPQVMDILSRSWVGVNAMWNEHFGIGVVEYMAAGLIPVVHNTAGPKLDIVTTYDGKPTGFHATDVSSFAQAFEDVFAMSEQETIAMRHRARLSSQRFSENVFDQSWSEIMSFIMRQQKRKHLH